MIEGGRDLKAMETLMGTTQEVIDTHITSYKTLQTKILDINTDAEAAIKDLSFYEGENPSGGLNDKLQQLDVVKEDQEEDDIAQYIETGNVRSHES